MVNITINKGAGFAPNDSIPNVANTVLSLTVYSVLKSNDCMVK